MARGDQKGTIHKRACERRQKTGRRCQWIDEETGNQCDKEATGYYFCNTHFKAAGEIEYNCHCVYEANDTIKKEIGKDVELSEIEDIKIWRD